MHYSNIYSFGRSVAQRLRVVDSTEQYKLKNNRLRQFERALMAKKGRLSFWGFVFFFFFFFCEAFQFPGGRYIITDMNRYDIITVM